MADKGVGALRYYVRCGGLHVMRVGNQASLDSAELFVRDAFLCNVGATMDRCSTHTYRLASIMPSPNASISHLNLHLHQSSLNFCLPINLRLQQASLGGEESQQNQPQEGRGRRPPRGGVDPTDCLLWRWKQPGGGGSCLFREE